MGVSVKKAKRIYKLMVNVNGEREFPVVKWCHRRKLFLLTDWIGNKSLGLMTSYDKTIYKF